MNPALSIARALTRVSLHNLDVAIRLLAQIPYLTPANRPQIEHISDQRYEPAVLAFRSSGYIAGKAHH